MGHSTPHARVVHMATGLEREMASVAPGIYQFPPGGFHTGNYHQFTASSSRKHVTHVAEAATISILLGPICSWTLLCGLPINMMSNSPALCTPIIRIWGQYLELAAFLKHPVFTAIVIDAAIAYSCMTDCMVLTWTLFEVQACATDHDHCSFCIYPQALPQAPTVLSPDGPWPPPQTLGSNPRQHRHASTLIISIFYQKKCLP